MAGVYVDDLARLNNEIHEQINDLYPCHGKTAEQEAALCLSLLMGYSVSKSILLTIEKSVTYHLQ